MTTWLNLEDIMLSALSQTENDFKHHMVSLICEILKKNVELIETVEKWLSGAGEWVK